MNKGVYGITCVFLFLKFTYGATLFVYRIFSNISEPLSKVRVSITQVTRRKNTVNSYSNRLHVVSNTNKAHLKVQSLSTDDTRNIY